MASGWENLSAVDWAHSRLIETHATQDALRLEAGGLVVLRPAGGVVVAPARWLACCQSINRSAFVPALSHVEASGAVLPALERVQGDGVALLLPATGQAQVTRFTEDHGAVLVTRVIAWETALETSLFARHSGGHLTDDALWLRLRGNGCVAFWSRSTPIACKVRESQPLEIAREHLIGWIGHIDFLPGRDEDTCLCSGEGAAIIDLPADDVRARVWHEGLVDVDSGAPRRDLGAR